MASKIVTRDKRSNQLATIIDQFGLYVYFSFKVQRSDRCAILISGYEYN